MKKSISIVAITVLMAGTILTSCQTSANKVKNAEDKLNKEKVDVLEAKQDLDQIRKDSITDYNKFKMESEEKINGYEKRIAELKTKIATEKKEDKSAYEKQLAQLEKKNSEMKEKLVNYKEEGQEKWVSFKNEFNHDMDELGKAFNDLTKNNVE
jgi:predicted small secreted protein